MFKYFLVVILLGFSTVAHADDGNKIYDYYLSYADKSNERSLLKAGLYVGYIEGVADSFDKTTFCIPNNVIGKQLFDIVGQYLTNHPEGRTLKASLLVEIALSEAFPCKK